MVRSLQKFMEIALSLSTMSLKAYLKANFTPAKPKEAKESDVPDELLDRLGFSKEVYDKKLLAPMRFSDSETHLIQEEFRKHEQDPLLS